ncbi:hypothetical protein C8J56DRAFT_891728 [Mycena floridula]|nr:hypothetical protein C8J56DRAFT_891728 [Mycena floridula]
MLCAKFIFAAFSAFVAVSAAPGAGALRRQSESRIFLLDEDGIKIDPSSAERKVPRFNIWMLKDPILLSSYIWFIWFVYLVRSPSMVPWFSDLICLSSSDGVPNGLPSDGLDPTESGDGVFGHLSNRERGNKKAWAK